MNFECKIIGLKLVLSDKLIAEMRAFGLKYYPKEFGGILVGRYSEDMKTCIIDQTILPKRYKSSQYYFVRGKEGLLEALSFYYNQTPRLIYIGEWHTHPNMKPEPSETDKNAMQEIADHEDVLIKSPVMIILGITKENMEIGVYIQFKNQLQKYEQQN